MQEYLREFYFDPNHPSSFSGPRKVYRELKKAGYKPTYKSIEEWVSNAEAFSLNRPARKKFLRQRIIVTDIDAQWDIDLTDMKHWSEFNDGVTFILVAIDILSRYAWLRALKTKQAKEVKEVIASIFAEGRKPGKLRSDKGTEFNNKILKKYLKDHNVHYFTTQNEGKANYSERCIKTIKSKIIRYMTHNNTRRYVDKLQDFVNSYNNTFHRSIGMPPAKLTKEVAKNIWWKLYKPKNTLKHRSYKYKVGDIVRISFLKNTFSREYDERWSGELFSIVHRYRSQGIPLYKLKDYGGEEIKGSFYTQEIQKVDPGEVFKVEKVLKRRTKNGEKQVLIKWLRWPDKYNSWEPESSIIKVYNRN